MIVRGSRRGRLSLNNLQNVREACKIKVSRTYFLPRDVNMMLRIRAATFPTRFSDRVGIC